MAEVRISPSSGTKYCGQCSFFGGQRKVQGSYLIYEQNTNGNCNRRSGTGSCAGRNVKATHSCSAFERWKF